MEGNKLDFEHWVSEFNSLRETITIDKFNFGNSVEFMDLYIYKGDEFFVTGKLDILYLCFKKKKTNICIFHVKVGIKNTRFVILSLENYGDTSDALHKNLVS